MIQNENQDLFHLTLSFGTLKRITKGNFFEKQFGGRRSKL